MEDFGLETEATLHWHRLIDVSSQSRPQEALAPFENETSVTSAVIVATANDRAVTARGCCKRFTC